MDEKIINHILHKKDGENWIPFTPEEYTKHILYLRKLAYNLKASIDHLISQPPNLISNQN